MRIPDKKIERVPATSKLASHEARRLSRGHGSAPVHGLSGV
jgi:hypothetical protein